MAEAPEKLAAQLEKEGKKTLSFFEKIEDKKWEEKVYSEGTSWTVQEVFTHVVETEGSIPRLIAHILDGGPGVPEDFDINQYNERHVAEMDGMSPGELLDAFAERREATVQLVRGMGAEDLAVEGRHPFLGQAPILEMVRLMYLHVQLHQRDIRRAMKRV